MAASDTRFHPQVPKEFERYLIPTENIIFALRRHWIILVEPIATVVVWLGLIGFLNAQLPDGLLFLLDVSMVLWLVLLARLIWKVVDWYQEIFLATDRRLVLVYGIIVRKVAMMPMAKVTDMRYDRTLLGMMFNYGVYVLESAGQDQALTKVKFIPDPDMHYQQISQVIFAPPQRRLSDKLVPASTGSKIPINEPEQSWWRR
jgi:uncharacterized membrane protein YdbT with pleckstrin-like domain